VNRRKKFTQWKLFEEISRNFLLNVRLIDNLVLISLKYIKYIDTSLLLYQTFIILQNSYVLCNYKDIKY